MKLPARILTIGLVAVLTLGISSILYLNRAPPPITEWLPNPNGFDELVNVEASWRSAPDSAQKAQCLPLLRSALSKESRMPLAVAREVFSNPPAQASKAFITGLVAMAEEALAAGRGRESAQVWNDALRFGPARVQGGLVIHRMIAMAGEKRILNSIESNSDRLDPADRQELAATLRELDAQWEPASVLFDRDLRVSLEQVPPSLRWQQRLAAVFLGSLKKVEAKVTQNIESASVRRATLAQNLER